MPHLKCHLLVATLLVMLMAMAEATPPGIAKNPSNARCMIKKYKHCYNLVHVCPKFCPDECTVECVSCKPICSGASNPPPEEDSPTPSTPSTPPPPEESVPTPATSPPTSPPTPLDRTPPATSTPPPSTPTSSTPSPPAVTTPPPSPPTPVHPTPPATSTPSPSPPTTPSTPTPKPPSPTPPLSPSPPTMNPSTYSPPPPTITPSSPSPPTPTTLTTPTPPSSTPTPPSSSPTPPSSSPTPPSSSPTPVTPNSPSKPSSPSPTPSTPTPPQPSTTPSPPPIPTTSTPETPPPNSPPLIPSGPSPTPPNTTPSSNPPSTPSSSPPPETDSSGQKRVRCKNKNYPQCYNINHVCPSACPTGCEVDCVSCKPVCKCDRPGAVCQDPRFIGGDGITFYFHGKKEHDFCLVSDPNLHINAHFIGRRNQNLNRDFTWVQSLGILFENHQLFISAQKTAIWDDSIDRLSLSLNNKPITLPESEGTRWQSNSTPSVFIVRLAATNSIMFEVEGTFRITAKVVPITEEDSRVHNYGITKENSFAHLDVGFKFFSLSSQVSGVLGQTYSPDYVSQINVKANMPVMGRGNDFETSSLFATDCAVSRFIGGNGSNSEATTSGVDEA